MHWYDGSIAEAVSLSKQRNSIFVVFVEDENELSQEMAKTLDEAGVRERLADPNNFLAVKLQSGSDTYLHFARMYQFVPVPSVFFIGRNGTPLEVVCAGVEPANLAARIDRILDEHQKGEPNASRAPNAEPSPVQPSTSGLNVREQTTSLLKAEQAAKVRERDPETETAAGPASKVQKTAHAPSPAPSAPAPAPAVPQYEVVCDGDVCVRVARPNETGPSERASSMETSEPSPVAASEIAPSVDSKLERAAQLLEMKKREKAEKEKELERQKEMERRATGQGVAELKRWQADQEMKQIQDERRREKLENQQARQRVLDQIAQDRAERRAREQPSMPSAPEVPTPSAASLTPVGDGGGVRARIQFKLPDGTSHTTHFDAEAPLSTVQRYVADNLQLAPDDFALWTAFPRRELTQSEATLRALQLAPSAALLLLPRGGGGGTGPVARGTALKTLLALLSQLVSTIFATPGNLWTWLRGAPPAAPPAGPPAPPGPPPPQGPRAAGLRYRPTSNIHRLTGDDERPADDDNNTWNGNSTQQM